MITSAAVVAACTTSASTLSKTGRHRRSLVGIACSPVIFSFAREPSESPMLQKRFSFFALSTSSDRTKVKYKERRRRRWCKHGSATYERSATRKKRRKKSGGFYSRMIAARHNARRLHIYFYVAIFTRASDYACPPPP